MTELVCTDIQKKGILSQHDDTRAINRTANHII